MLNSKRVTLFCGHYGSGKTNIAVNYALQLRKEGNPVSIADLDIVNPYFRTKDSEEELEEAGIKVIASIYAGSNVDLPALPSEVYSLFQNRNQKVVVDVGGDDRGALALGRYVPMILEEQNYDMLFVVNFYRPLTQNAEDAMEVMREIESACGIRCTGIVNNSNLGPETTMQTILQKNDELKRLSELSGLPVAFTSASKKVAAEGMLALSLQKKIIDEV